MDIIKIISIALCVLELSPMLWHDMKRIGLSCPFLLSDLQSVKPAIGIVLAI